MAEIKIKLHSGKCDNCSKPFKDGDIIYSSELDGRQYCEKCFSQADMEECGFDEDDFGRYIIDDGVGRLAIDKENVPYYEFMDCSIYEFVDTGDNIEIKNIYDSEIKGIYNIEKFNKDRIKAVNEGSFFIQNIGDCLGVCILFPSSLYTDEFEFVNYVSDDYDLWESYKTPVMSARRVEENVTDYIDAIDVCYICRENKIIGIIETPVFSYNCSDLQAFSVLVNSSMTVKCFDDMEEDYKCNYGTDDEDEDMISDTDEYMIYDASEYVVNAKSPDEDVVESNVVFKNHYGFKSRDMMDYFKGRIHGHDRELKKAVYIIYKYLESIMKGKDFPADNWWLVGPSGSGKTEFYRTLKAFFKMYNVFIPVVRIDLSQLTEVGFKGDNVDIIPKKILSDRPYSDGRAICFLDEADKKCIPSYDSNRSNVHELFQNNLLTLVEGIKLSVEVNGETMKFDSGKTMFIFMGAFQKMRNEKKKANTKSNRMGFAVGNFKDEQRNKSNEDDYDELTIDDLIEEGLIEELAGRTSQVVNFHKITRKEMRSLIKCKADEISKEMDINIEITNKAVNEFLTISFGDLGVRAPMNKIKELVQGAVADVFFEEGFDNKKDKVVINSLKSAKIKHGEIMVHEM